MRLYNLSIRAALLASITAGLATGAIAQAPAPVATETADTAADDDLIIVTASKRSATLQDTPISVAVATAATIERAQVRDLIDLQTLVPSLRVAQLQSSANTNFIIRGFGNGANNVGIEPSVGVFIDGVYRSRSAAQIGDLPELERVEVLRGPQSTLFGKNASAGIVSVVTREPQFDFGGNAEVSYGNYNAIIAKGSITGPINETIAFSLAGNFNKRDGYGRDLNLNTDISDRNRWGARGSLLFKPSDDFKLRIIADYDKIDENCCIVANLVDGPTGGAVRAVGGRIASQQPFSYTQFTNFESTNNIENYGVSAQADWNLNDNLALTAIGSYRGVNIDTDQDSDFTSADLIGRNAAQNQIRTYTAEVRLASTFDGPVNFLLGAFYFHENIDSSAQLTFGRDFRNYANILSGGGYTQLERPLGFPTGTFGAQGQGRFENYDYKNRAISVFGQVDYELADGLILTAGGNYTRDRKDVSSNTNSTDVFSSLDLVQVGRGIGIPGAAAAVNCGATSAPGTCNPLLALQPLQFLPPFLNFPNAVEDGKTRDNNFSYTLRAAYKLSDSFSTYVTYATGFKASSWNLSFDSRPFAADFIPGSAFAVPAPAASPIRNAGLALPNLTSGTRYAGPEDASVYEAGLKGQFTGFNFNLAVFQQALKGFQSNVFVGTGFVLVNAEKQSTFGIELDTVFNPVRNLNFTANLTYLNPKYDQFTAGSALGANFTNTSVDLSGQRPAGIPEFSIAVGSNLTHEFSDTLKALFHIDFNHQSNVQIADGAPQFRREINLLNASVGLGIGNGLEVTAWARNLANDQYIALVFPGVAQAGTLSGYPSQPRTYGGSIRYRF